MTHASRVLAQLKEAAEDEETPDHLRERLEERIDDLDEDAPECKLPGCSKLARGGGGFSGRFCSDQCEVKYEHIKADADDARRAAEEEANGEVNRGP